ncbi:hypothetical protein PY310_13315 [Pseudarthrobacter sp. H3Y2-7]|uniref:hypothetical protein n=1 Tax=Pseudarthrobacter naphthalenicus TaxID=3031328 RepID=UPI0023B018FC|nr:hypothetical protein [Pseudarthrobacter sp. H3Y2-7]MDE8669556.1 hypothetical protein [Pseudarthrobacter sp. H3Y2-7]
MTPVKRLNRTELATKYPDEQWRQKLLDLLSLVAILRGCVIDNSYRPSEELNAAILLSDVGTRIRSQLTTKEKVNAKDANVLALLGLVHVEPLVDVERIDLDQLAAAISGEIVAGELRFPLVFGRSLYDRAAELFNEERDYLNHEDTLRLLEGMPQGVFQAGRYLIGPYGLRKRDFERHLNPTTSVPLQHCADYACGLVHRVQLTTSIEAGVNKSRPSLNKLLDQISDDPSEWNAFVADFTESRINGYSVEGHSTICYLIGDAFSDHELRNLVIQATKIRGAELHEAKISLGLGGQDQDLELMNRPQLLQLLFMLPDASLVEILDSSVQDSVISIPGDEVRRPRTNASLRSGAWNLRSQISRLGTRAVSVDSSLPLLRLSSLARSLFDVDSPDEIEELAWILRGTVGNTPRERLEEFLRTSEPIQVIETLVLARRANANKVCTALGIPINQDNRSLRDSILWKLGFPLPRSSDLRDEYWRLHHGLESLAKTASVELTRTAEGLRAASSDYFVCLERFLFDSLSFATWALLEDHYSSNDPFVFFETQARAFTISTLNATVDESEDKYGLSDEPVLSSIVEGYIRLSKLLGNLRERSELHRRDSDGFPQFAKLTSLQQFPFAHVHPFLDLLPESQVKLKDALAEIGSELKNSGIMTARNGLHHAKTRVPTVAEVEEALQKARAALDRLESVGCVRGTYSIASTHINAWGGATTTLTSNGRSISFSTPSAFAWTNCQVSTVRFI